MKVGIRTPNIEKSIRAKTTGKVKRKINSVANPLYGRKGMGYINNPQKAIYSKVYNKTSTNFIKTTIPKSGDGLFVGVIKICFLPLSVTLWLFYHAILFIKSISKK